MKTRKQTFKAKPNTKSHKRKRINGKSKHTEPTTEEYEDDYIEPDYDESESYRPIQYDKEKDKKKIVKKIVKKIEKKNKKKIDMNVQKRVESVDDGDDVGCEDSEDSDKSEGISEDSEDSDKSEGISEDSEKSEKSEGMSEESEDESEGSELLKNPPKKKNKIIQENNQFTFDDHTIDITSDDDLNQKDNSIFPKDSTIRQDSNSEDQYIVLYESIGLQMRFTSGMFKRRPIHQIREYKQNLSWSSSETNWYPSPKGLVVQKNMINSIINNKDNILKLFK